MLSQAKWLVYCSLVKPRFVVNRFQKINLTAIYLTLFLILVGGFVRAAGAGLGCPDWPRCFGSWIPPSNASMLPASFDPAQFNVYKTWIEYVNRLVGVLIGFSIILTAASSLSYRKSKPKVTFLAISALVLVIFQGWLGGQVVFSALQGWLITAHMFVAFLMVFALMLSFDLSFPRSYFTLPDSAKVLRSLQPIFYALVVFTFLQVLVGTQVREALDHVADTGVARNLWVEQAGWLPLFHRTFSWTVVLLTLLLWWQIKKKNPSMRLQKGFALISLLILLQILLGIGLHYWSVPAAFQVLHLVFASLLLSGQFAGILALRNAGISIQAPSEGKALSV